MGYALPSNTDHVSCSWQCHRNRNPPSTEPGTDYASAFNSPLYASEAGKVVDLKTSTSSATGRYVTIDMDDGRRTRSLHLQEIWVKVGQRVSRGQQIGKTGASGYGSEWGYGPHVHQTLWNCHCQNFCSSCTIDFALYVGGGGPIAGNQRQVLSSAPANGRSDPSTANPATQQLPPNAVGDFNGWIYGETVSGNNTWFQGAHSGDWFWSGGFTDTGTHDLSDKNPPPVTGTQRIVGPNGVNGRDIPDVTGTLKQTLAPNAVADLNGWTYGGTVEGNNSWFRGQHSGDWFWSGGFTDIGNHDLPYVDTTPVPPPTGVDRVVLSTADANIRPLPYTTSTATGSEPPSAVVPMAGWTHGEAVSGNDVWFQRVDGKWMWSGGFTSQATDGLTEVPAPPPDGGGGGGDPDNPRGLEEYLPFYPRAEIGLVAPLGFTDCANPVTPMPRTVKGSPPVPTPALIDRFIIHHTATTVDQLDWFSYCNSRSVCPTFYLRTDGSVFEMIRPGSKPAATGSNWNYRSIAVETLNKTGAPGYEVTEAQLEELAQMIAWLASFNGKTLDGCPVSFTIDRTHVISHQETMATECPGPYLQSRMDQIVARAKAIAGGGPPPDPCEDCPCEECPECPDPTDPNSRVVSVETLVRWRSSALWPIGSEIDTVINATESRRR